MFLFSFFVIRNSVLEPPSENFIPDVFNNFKLQIAIIENFIKNPNLLVIFYHFRAYILKYTEISKNFQSKFLDKNANRNYYSIHRRCWHIIDKNIRIKEIAERAGVSPSTVSRVINGTGSASQAATEAVNKVLEELNIESPRANTKKPQPAARKNGLVFILVPEGNSNPFFSKVIRGASDSIASHGHTPLIYEQPIHPGNIGEFISLVHSLHIVGVISLCRFDEQMVEKLNKEMNFVQCCQASNNPNIACVGVDDQAAMYSATDHVISLGRRKIALIMGKHNTKFSQRREDGFWKAISNAEISVPSNWVINIPSSSYRAAFSAATQLFSREVCPNAVIAVTDIMAIGVINAALRKSLRVPEDVMVVGFDNIDQSEMCVPSLTTINQPRYEIGYAAGEIIQERYVNPSVAPKSLVMNSELIVRESTLRGFNPNLY